MQRSLGAFGDVELKDRKRVHIPGRPKGVCIEGTRGSPYHMRGDGYSLSGIRFQREQVASGSSGLLHPHVGQRDF